MGKSPVYLGMMPGYAGFFGIPSCQGGAGRSVLGFALPKAGQGPAMQWGMPWSRFQGREKFSKNQ